MISGFSWSKDIEGMVVYVGPAESDLECMVKFEERRGRWTRDGTVDRWIDDELGMEVDLENEILTFAIGFVVYEVLLLALGIYSCCVSQRCKQCELRQTYHSSCARDICHNLTVRPLPCHRQRKRGHR